MHDPGEKWKKLFSVQMWEETKATSLPVSLSAKILLRIRKSINVPGSEKVKGTSREEVKS